MSESKFTKPLAVLEVGERDPMIGIEDEFADGQHFCTVAKTVTHSLISRDEAVRYAHLFAAAPALYEALRNLLGEYIKGAESGDWGNWDAYQQPEVIAARAALIKATPEQSDV